MAKYKYILPDKVYHLFLGKDFEEVTYKGIRYFKEASSNAMSLNVMTSNQANDLIRNHPGLLRSEDFVEVVTTEDLVKQRVQELLDDLSNRLEHTEGEVIIKISRTSYTHDKVFFIDKNDNIFGVNENAAFGIENDLKKHLLDKSTHLEFFEYQIITDFKWHDIFENVHRYYYYLPNISASANTGAGTLTGWLIFSELVSRKDTKKDGIQIQKLQTSFRLKKEI